MGSQTNKQTNKQKWNGITQEVFYMGNLHISRCREGQRQDIQARTSLC